MTGPEVGLAARARAWRDADPDPETRSELDMLLGDDSHGDGYDKANTTGKRDCDPDGGRNRHAYAKSRGFAYIDTAANFHGRGDVDSASDLDSASDVDTATESPARPVPGTKSANRSFDSVIVSPLARVRTLRRVRICVAGRMMETLVSEPTAVAPLPRTV